MAGGKDVKEQGDRPHFSSKLGLICSCLGCMVGTGNIWRFPRIVATNSRDEGGLVFLLVWFFFLMFWSIPMLLIEYGTGRYTQKAVVDSFRQFVGNKAAWCGAWITIVSFMISCYYSVILGWCFYYFIYCIFHELPTEVEESQAIFLDFAEKSAWPVLTHGIAIVIAGLSVVKGVKTIEKVNMFLVPVLLLILLFTFVWSLTRKYADIGIKYLFTPNWDSFGDPRVWVDALSQNAFDTGAGSGLMIPYSSYMTRENGIVRYGTLIPTANNLVSLISGITVFSTVFSAIIVTQPSLTQSQIVAIIKDSGPGSTGLTFIWIPVLFSSVGIFGRVLSILFFLTLSFAGVTSLISNIELFTHTLQDFGLKRRYGTPLTVAVTFLIGLMSALNLDILTNQDFVWGFALVINGLMLQAMVIIYGVKRFRTEVVNNFGVGDWKLPCVWDWIVKVVAPLEGVVLIVWWAIDLISNSSGDGEKWYEFGRETFIVTVVQWFGLMMLTILCNVVAIVCVSRWSKSSTYMVFQDTSHLEPLTASEPEYGSVSKKDLHSSQTYQDIKL
ncbi:uncharacterized sodium-dependent transporter YocR-like [Haliotis cracherodii]|uniref:uncharacterized sodium-dependent transporter YocR-like n=1 Tax=Haliotis cracherodii TaxID=6455 RepID=UPI0039E7C174